MDTARPQHALALLGISTAVPLLLSKQACEEVMGEAAVLLDLGALIQVAEGCRARQMVAPEARS